MAFRMLPMQINWRTLWRHRRSFGKQSSVRRDSDFNHVDPGSYDAVKDRVATNHPLYSQFISYYNSMEANVQKHSKVPSFFAKSTSKAQEIELAWNGTNYSAT